MGNHIYQNQTRELEEIYFPDSAIEAEEADLLGFGKFANRITNALEINSSQKGFVIGVQAKWGQGKSSLLNLVARRIKGLENFVILRYNPWLVPEANHISVFFHELAKVAKDKKSDTEIQNKIRIYGAITALIETTKSSYEKIYDTLALVFASVVLGSSSFGAPRWILISMVIVLILTMVVKIIHPLIEAKWKKLKSQTTDKKTLSELKKELNTDLQASGIRYVVILDDIDRLPPDQICEIFQIVKNNGDLANISYILAYDKEVVQEVLAQKYSNLYRSFPEKIVQIEFALPYPDRVKLNEFFLENIYKSLKRILPVAVYEGFDHVRLENYYFIYLQHFFSSLREAKRILNAIQFNLNHMVNGDHLEVNPIDFIIMELFRIQLPKLYEFMRTNKPVFVYIENVTEIVGPLPDTSGYFKQLYDEEMSSLKGSRGYPKLNELLEDLFPRLKTLGSTQESNFVDQGSKNLLRICWGEVYDRYFLYDNYKGDIPNSLISSLIKNLGREEIIEDLLGPHFKTGAVREIIVRVLDQVLHSDAKKYHDVNLVSLIFQTSDYMVNNLETWLRSDNSRNFIIRQLEYVLKDNGVQRRGDLVERALSRLQSVAGPLFLAVNEESKVKNDKTEKLLFAEDSRAWLKRASCQRALKWLENDSCLDHPLFVEVLYDAKRICDCQKLDTALIVLLKKNDFNYKKFLARFVRNTGPIGYGMVASHPKYELNFDALDNIIDVGELKRLRQGIHFEEGETELYKIAWELLQEGSHEFLRKKRENSKE